VVQVEGGFFLYSGSDLQSEQVAIAYSRWPVDVINLGREDLSYAKILLTQEGLNDRIKRLPMIKNLISANAVFGPSFAAPPAYTIKEVAGPRIHDGKKKLKIGFVGVAAPNNPGDGMRDATVRNMFEAATRAVLKARKECDLLVIIAHCELDQALKLAAENLDADVVIAADSGGLYNPRRVGNTLVVSAAPGNIREGDLRVYLNKNGQVDFKFLSTDLDAQVPSDPAAMAFVEAARAERDRLR
jgi:2',3'-cyclic-nucleotide 2'-phosphodiesterase (5'-nucleotidase family)